MPQILRQIRVFLCHASQDKFAVRELQTRLANEGWIDPWLDEKKLHPGEEWRMAIEEAVERSDLVVICLSNNSVNKEGFVQKELRYAREIALEKPEGTIFLIPLRLDNCEVPRGLRFFQWTDYFGEKKEQNYNELLEALSIRRLQVIRREEEIARKDAEEREKREREEQARREEEARITHEKEELARKLAEEEHAQRAALEKVRKEAFESALMQAQERAKLEAELTVRKELEEKDRQNEVPPISSPKLGTTNFVPVLVLVALILLITGLLLGLGLGRIAELSSELFAKTTTPSIPASTTTSSQAVLTSTPAIMSPSTTETSPITPGLKLYVTNRDDGIITVVDTGSNSIVGTISTGRTAQGIASNPDHTIAYSADSESNRVSVIDLQNDSLITTISVDQGPVIPAINYAGNRLYVTRVCMQNIK